MVHVIVENPTAQPLFVDYTPVFTSRGGARVVSRAKGGTFPAGTRGDRYAESFFPLRDLASIPPDPTAVLARIELTDVRVCPNPPRPEGNSAVYVKPCDGKPVARGQFSGTPICPDFGQGEPNYGYTALMVAARDKDLARVWQIVSCGSDVNVQAKDGYTALMFAANSGATETTEILLRAGARTDLRQDRDKTVYDIVGDAFPEILLLLQRYGRSR